MENEARIERYLTGEMEQEEVKAFEQEIKTNAALKEEVRLHQTIQVGVQELFQEKAKTHFASIEEKAKGLQDSNSNKQKKGLVRWMGLAVAASLLLLLWIWNPFAQPNPQTLFADYYSSYPNYAENIERSDGASSDDYKNAFMAYEQKNYKAAETLFEILPKEDPSVQLYWGLSLLELNKMEVAIPHLEISAKAAEHRYSQVANWYWALALIHIGNVEDAKVILERLVKENSSYKEKAATLLSELS